MKSSPLPRSTGVSAGPMRANQVSLVSMFLGGLALAVGVGLALLTLAGAIDGFAVIGFYDLAVGGMFLAFSWQSSKFGYEVITGRQTVTGEIIG